ncbi:hypothetical protein KOW79_000459 [Hemibagrus wyckioides]|uniref:Interleukin 6 receptor n=1 Tax=Hemibagrus wyckioides TaxID=337641 RepID=A0A9D3SSH1_9TELE|nr:interleukin-6 receptor subunit alpha-like isoform X2 [Hemibagrus wyckioides]KAG7335766.1 hypothetical protein KOW79_000459 [Hemibagrus wyckioides]
MSVPIAFTLLVLCVVKVQCGQESPVCPRKESHPGVLALNMGSEVILGCRGDVTVDRVLLVMGTKPKERHKKRGDITSHWRPRENPDALGKHHPETVNFTTPGMYKINTETKVSDSVTSANPAMSSAKEKVGNGQISLAVNQFTKFNSVGRVTEEGGAFSITMEMGLRTERSTSTEYEEDEDYKEKVDGLRVTRSIKRQARWTRNGQLVRVGVEHGGVLRLPALQLTDSGNYSCYRRGKLVSSVKISVGIPPVSPTLSCHKKSHISQIQCEWISRQPIIPQPQCYLLHRKGFEKISRVNCSYSAACSCCWCVLPSSEDDRNVYTAKLCVTNTAGNATSSLYSYISQDIIKPDPPDGVEVKPVKGEPQILNVSWSLPATWMWEFYYTLNFQLRYRPLLANEYQKVDTDSKCWLILDALPDCDYEIQIRAKDEYDGQWSDWTRPVHARTWTAPETTAAPDFNTVEPVHIFSDGSGGTEGDIDFRPADDGDGVVWVYVLWVMGFSLLITIIIVAVYTLRWRMPFLTKKSQGSVSSPFPLLQQPLKTLKCSYQEKEEGGIHLHNVDYFFSPYGLARS